jgi:two-component system, chemotaxis family, sensor kinase Cph1
VLNTIETDDVTSCDLEPIHIPGTIQPHGGMIVADGNADRIIGTAGRAEVFLGGDLSGRALADVIGTKCFARIAEAEEGRIIVLGKLQGQTGWLNLVAYRSGGLVVVELDKADVEAALTATILADLDSIVTSFEKSATLEALYRVAASTYRKMTGYGRVMIYQFLDDDAGVVVGESLDGEADSFMHHHFPASDIPKQARALYVRNRIRVIPDVGYEPQPIRSISGNLRELDLSDSTLRSVSPVHIQYLKNMGVAASASISIIKDGILWGLIACHHNEPREIPLDVRVACQALAGSLSRQIRAKEDADILKERIRLRTQEEAVLVKMGDDTSLSEFFDRSGGELAALLRADGFAAAQGSDLFVSGKCPDRIDLREVADFVRQPAALQPLATDHLSKSMPKAEAFADLASGLLAVTMSTEVPTILMWFRAEHLQVVEWAGNPHKGVPSQPGAILTPRSSFDAWTETVRHRSRPWNHAEVNTASRIVRLMLEQRNNKRVRILNSELTTTLKENESLLRQKDFLLKEVNHRVQNSLQLVAAFLRLQSKSSGDEAVRHQLAEADRRLNAVALVHRRLYRDDSVEVIDLSRYIEDLVNEMQTTMDQEWTRQFELDLSPILISTDRAVNVGLILTELVINAQKYAYGGKPGPLSVKLEQHRDKLRLIVADHGRGKDKATGTGTGFGARMLAAIIDRLKGHLDEEDNKPGLRTIVTAPIDLPSA